MSFHQFCLAVVILFSGFTQGNAQTDPVKTLRWVEYQANRIDTLLQDGILTNNQTTLILRLTDAYVLFDAVDHAGLNCPGIREASHAGRNLCDILNYRLEKDMMSTILRATKARLEASRMINAARKCNEKQPGPGGINVDLPGILRDDAQSVILLLEEAMTATSQHAQSQKTGAAIFMLQEIRHLAATLVSCAYLDKVADQAIASCETALAASDTRNAGKALREAIAEVKRIRDSTCTD